MNRLLTVALAATAIVATPAMAQNAAPTFTGARVGVNVGFADDNIFGTEAFNYGADVGHDFAAGGAILGITAEIEDSKDLSRALALTARAGARLAATPCFRLRVVTRTFAPMARTSMASVLPPVASSPSVRAPTSS